MQIKIWDVSHYFLTVPSDPNFRQTLTNCLVTEEWVWRRITHDFCSVEYSANTQWVPSTVGEAWSQKGQQAPLTYFLQTSSSDKASSHGQGASAFHINISTGHVGRGHWPPPWTQKVFFTFIDHLAKKMEGLLLASCSLASCILQTRWYLKAPQEEKRQAKSLELSLALSLFELLLIFKTGFITAKQAFCR